MEYEKYPEVLAESIRVMESDRSIVAEKALVTEVMLRDGRVAQVQLVVTVAKSEFIE